VWRKGEEMVERNGGKGYCDRWWKRDPKMPAKQNKPTKIK
jgi:hypothetical protein